MSQTLFYGGTILTMEEPLIAEAVLITDGLITAVGDRKRLELSAKPDCRRYSLDGAVLLPAFLDAHSHLTSLASTLGFMSLSHTKNFDDILTSCQSYQMTHQLKPGEWVIGFGYDHNFLKEKQHPDRFLLDRAFPDNPVLITHTSGHMGVLNSTALQKMGIDSSTPDPAGGKIGRCGNSSEPNGYLEETAFTQLTSKIPMPGKEQQCKQLEAAQQIYFRHGVTTIQDGLTKQSEWELLQAMAEQNRLSADIISYVDMREHRALPEQHPQYVKRYQNHLKIGGYKIFLDGSPQGRTAWMTKPYLPVSEGYCGYPIYQDEEVKNFIHTAVQNNMQLLAHCNGDAAAEQYLRACRSVPESKALRPVMIHAQLVRQDQLAQMADCNMIASFFTAHTYYWGDIHCKNFGKERAMHISPARSAMDAGVCCTFHQDSPVLPPDMLHTVWCAVNRLSKEGVVMGNSERVTVLDALKSVTINAAYQYFEETQKGSIAPKKLADFVILDQNPLTVDPLEIKNIKVLQTIKEGRELL